MRNLMTLATVVVLASLTAGCEEDLVHFSDSIDLTFDFAQINPYRPPVNELHQPYVVGTQFWMNAIRNHDDMDMSDSWAESGNQNAMELSGHTRDDEAISYRCQANDVGYSTITVYRSDYMVSQLGSVVVEVAVPNRADVTFSGPYFIHGDEYKYRVDDHVNVMTGGMATFLVEYYDGARKLNGNNVLQISTSGDGIDAFSDQTYLFEDREWLSIMPLDPGQHTVTLSVAGNTVAEFTVNAVEEADVAYIGLEAESERYAEDGEVLAVLALGYTDDSEPIYGIEFDWQVDGWERYGEGDLYKYPFHPKMESTLKAEFGDHYDQVDVHGGEDGWVSSTNLVGCSATPQSTGSAAGILAPLLAALGLWAMRRGRTPLRSQD